MTDADQASVEAMRQDVTNPGSATTAVLGQGFVQPSSYLRPQRRSRPVTPAPPSSSIDREQAEGLVSSLSPCLAGVALLLPWSLMVLISKDLELIEPDNSVLFGLSSKCGPAMMCFL
jgi:hypothetical protein